MQSYNSNFGRLTFSPFLTKQLLITRPAAHFSVVFGSIIAVDTKDLH